MKNGTAITWCSYFLCRAAHPAITASRTHASIVQKLRVGKKGYGMALRRMFGMLVSLFKVGKEVLHRLGLLPPAYESRVCLLAWFQSSLGMTLSEAWARQWRKYCTTASLSKRKPRMDRISRGCSPRLRSWWAANSGCSLVRVRRAVVPWRHRWRDCSTHRFEACRPSLTCGTVSWGIEGVTDTACR